MFLLPDNVFFFSSLLFSFFPHGTFLSLGRHGRTLNTTSFNCVHATISVWFSGKSLSSGFLLWILVFSAYSKEKSTRTTWKCSLERKRKFKSIPDQCSVFTRISMEASKYFVEKQRVMLAISVSIKLISMLHIIHINLA